MHQVQITADDWGMSKGINEGILHLAEKGIVRRVSCFANARNLEYLLPNLLNLKEIEIGLHFNLTYGKPDISSGPIDLMLKSSRSHFLHLSNLEHFRKNIQTEFNSQVEHLKNAGVKKIHYFDGHHHCHLFPGMMSLIGPIALSKSIRFTRMIMDHSYSFSLRTVLSQLSKGASIESSRLGIKFNTCKYPYMATFKNVQTFKDYLSSLNSKTEVIVHPSAYDDSNTFEFPDSYTHQRVGEFRLLDSIQ